MTDKQKIACYKAKINSLNDEIAGLTGKCEALEQDKENLTRTLEECNEERDDLKTENGMLRSIMDKMLEKGKSLEDENKMLKIQLEQANAGNVNCIGCKLVEINAVNEFAEKLKEICVRKRQFIDIDDKEEYYFDGAVTIEEIDKLLKELEEWKTISNN